MCSIDGCNKPSKGRGWCSMHYSRYLRNGDPLNSKYSLSPNCLICGTKVSGRRAAFCSEWCRIQFNNKKWKKKNKDRALELTHNRRALLGTLPLEAGSRTFVFSFYQNKCLNCKSEKITLDHVVPLARGGTNHITNFQPLCRSCNGSKRLKVIDFRWDGGILMYEEWSTNGNN